MLFKVLGVRIVCVFKGRYGRFDTDFYIQYADCMMAEGNVQLENEGNVQLEKDVNKCNKGELEEWAGNLYEFIRLHKEICTRHMVDFFIDDVWSKLPQQWRENLLSHPLADLRTLALQCSRTCVAQGSLEEFLLQAMSFCIKKQCKQLTYIDGKHERLASFAMKAKKSYEVQNMSLKITDLCKADHINQVVISLQGACECWN